MTRTFLSSSSIKRVILLKRVMYNLGLSSCCLMFSRLVEDLLYLYPPMKWVTKCPLNSLKVETVLGVSLLNRTLTGPLRRVGNALHIISFGTSYRCMKVLKDFRWSSGSLDPSYVSTCGIWNFAERGKEVTGTVKGDSIR